MEHAGAADPYDLLGPGYGRHVVSAPYNALYERPALLGLLDDVVDADVLDLGCGPGLLTEVLVERGAQVTGLERSAVQLDLARDRLGGLATLIRHDLAEPLPCADESADVVVASLVLHYLPDWGPLLTEVGRVLRPGGRAVASVHHPFDDAAIPSVEPRGTYLESYPITDEWEMGGHTAPVRFWHHPLGTMVGWVVDAGLRLTGLVEPRPVPEMAQTHPRTHARLAAEPAFLLITAERPGREPGRAP